MSRKLIEIIGLSAKQNGVPVLQNIDLTIQEGEQWAILGNSGSGKTSLALALIGRLFYNGQILFHTKGIIDLVEQQHRFRTLSNTTDFYYQQRFQSQDAEDSLTIEEEVQPYLEKDKEETLQLLEQLHLTPLLQEPMIQLSNGENKRLQLVKSLLHHPSILILDNPFIGLDIDGRKLLQQIINTVSANGIHVILITTPEEIPSCITHVAVLDQGRLIFSGNRPEYHQQLPVKDSRHILTKEELSTLNRRVEHSFNSMVKMVDVTIRYGEKTILDKVNWEVKNGEHWSLSGPNGAGKSTLLSLITADNPQAYANEIYLFDKRRGRGESIWDIKKNIGFVSPEMHLYFPYTSTCFEVIASGLFDTTGLFRTINDEQEEQVNQWINLLELKDIAHKTLQQLSLGKQRMALLARALVKNPPLLVLDEPCQGLDHEQMVFFNSLVDQLCTSFNTTLIYVSHYREQLPDCINKHLYIEEGRVVKGQR